MNAVEKVEQSIYDDGITILSIKSESIPCMCMRICNTENILIDREKLSTYREQRVALTHEQKHIRKGEYRTFSCSYDSFSRYEREVRDETVNELFSFTDFEKALRRCQGHIWEMADELDVTEDVVQDAIDFYRRKGLLKRA